MIYCRYCLRAHTGATVQKPALLHHIIGLQASSAVKHVCCCRAKKIYQVCTWCEKKKCVRIDLKRRKITAGYRLSMYWQYQSTASINPLIDPASIFASSFYATYVQQIRHTKYGNPPNAGEWVRSYGASPTPPLLPSLPPSLGVVPLFSV